MDPLTSLGVDATKGSPRARESLIATAYPAAWQLCAALVERESADDLAQESFVRAVRALPSVRAGASARTWLLAIARLPCTDERRRRHRRRMGDAALAAIEGGPEALGDVPGEESVVVDLLSRLEADRRVAFVLAQQVARAPA